MNITFKNDCTSKKAIVLINNQKYIINPGETVDVFSESEKMNLSLKALLLMN